MKILELWIEKMRGIRDVYLRPEGKNLVIWGPNGSGKSGVVDAIDFLLSGRISRLTGKGTGGIRLAEHGPHVDWRPEDAKVRARIQLGGQAKPIEISRCIADPQELKCPEGSRAELEAIEVLAQRGQHMLTRRHILKYITAEASTRAEEIQELLDLSDVEEVRKAVVRSKNLLQEEYRFAEREVDSHKGRVCAGVQQKDYEESAILDMVNGCRATLSGKAVRTLDAGLIRNGLSHPGSGKNGSGVNVEILKRCVEHVRKLLEPESLGSVATQDENLRMVIAAINADPDLQRELDVLELAELGLKLLDDGTRCPLCDTTWEPEQLKRHLESKMLKGQQARRYQTELESAARALTGTVSNLAATVHDLVSAAGQLDLKNVEKRLAAWETWLGDVEQALSNPADEYSESDYPREEVWRLHAPEGDVELFNEMIDSATAKDPGTTPEQTAWETLTILQNNLEQLEGAVATCMKRKLARDRGELLRKNFEAARDSVLGQLYDNIKDRFVAFYRLLHQDEAEHFGASLQPVRAALELKVDFLGRGSHPPHALHSEGHQDSMGLCLFLALSERLSEGKIGIVVLDDVVMSVDDGHRRDICRLLRDGFPDRQFLITTHDRTWATQLRSDHVVDGDRLIEFLSWTIDKGPRVAHTRDLWQQIEDALRAEDVPEAAFRLRRGSEQYFEMVCDALEAEVPYKSHHGWALQHWLPAAKSRYGSVLKKAKAAAQSWGDDELFTQFQEQDSIRAQVFERAQVEQWSINAEVHYNNWCRLSSGEFRTVVEAFGDLYDLYRCSQCGGFLTVTLDGQTEVAVRCQCAKVNWNLQSQPGRRS